MRRSTHILSLLFGAVSLTGCITVSRDGGFNAVAGVVAGRTGQTIHWNQDTPADAQVHDRIGALLHAQLSADTAVQIALLNNQHLQATYEDLGIAQADLIDAGLLKNPTLTAELRFPRYAALPLEFDVVQSFVDLLVLPLRKRFAAAQFAAAQSRVINEVLTHAAKTKVAFYKVQGAEQILEVDHTALQATYASYEAARHMHDAGNVNNLVLANERALHEGAKIELRKAEAAVLSAREELSAALGVWGSDIEWTIAPLLPDVPPQDALPPSLESLAIAQRADLAELTQQTLAVAQTIGLSRSATLGDLQIGGHYERDSDGRQTAGPFISIPLPLFNQGQPAIAAAQGRYRQLQRSVQAMAIDIRSQVRQARNALVAARDQADYLGRVMIPLRHEITQNTQLQYNGMFVGIFQLLQAKQAEIDAGRDYVQALTDYWVARAQLERAIGGRLPPPPQATQPATQPVASDANHNQYHGE